MDRTRSPEDIYVPMNNISSPRSMSPRPMSPPKYETMEYIRSQMGTFEENAPNYPSMPLPPLPVVDGGEAPPLPARRKHGPQQPTNGKKFLNQQILKK